jgi:transposase
MIETPRPLASERWAMEPAARVEGVESANNMSEWALRPAVPWRKGCFGSDRAAATRFAVRLLTVVATCRQQGWPLLDFLIAAGEAALQGTAAPLLLPARPG